MNGVGRPLVRVACLTLLLLAACTTRGEQAEPPTRLPVDTATATMTPTPTPTATPTPTPTPTPMPTPEVSPTATIAPGFAALESELAAVVAAYPVAGQYAFALTDLQTGETIGVHAGERRLGACTMNFFVLLKVVHDVDTGAYPMTERIDALIAETIYSSNATTARELWAVVGDGDALAGVAETAAYISEELGLDGVILDHPPMFPEVSLCADPDNWITAHAANEVLARLYRGELLSPEWTGYLIEQMTHVKEGLNYLVACCNGGLTSHKNGFFPYEGGYVDNDIGIVRFWRGDVEYAYAVSFFSMEVKVKYDDIPLAQDLMSRSWAWFDAAYP